MGKLHSTCTALPRAPHQQPELLEGTGGTSSTAAALAFLFLSVTFRLFRLLVCLFWCLSAPLTAAAAATATAAVPLRIDYPHMLLLLGVVVAVAVTRSGVCACVFSRRRLLSGSERAERKARRRRRRRRGSERRRRRRDLVRLGRLGRERRGARCFNLGGHLHGCRDVAVQVAFEGKN
jgi:hypothetical protein